MRVGVVDSRGVDLEDLQARDRIGVRQIDEFEDFGTAEAGDLDRAHQPRLGARRSVVEKRHPMAHFDRRATSDSLRPRSALNLGTSHGSQRRFRP